MKIHPNKDTSGLNECIRCAHTQRTIPSQCWNKIRRCVCQSSVGETGRATAEELKPGAPCVHACMRATCGRLSSERSSRPSGHRVVYPDASVASRGAWTDVGRVPSGSQQVIPRRYV